MPTTARYRANAGPAEVCGVAIIKLARPDVDVAPTERDVVPETVPVDTWYVSAAVNAPTRGVFGPTREGTFEYIVDREWYRGDRPPSEVAHSVDAAQAGKIWIILGPQLLVDRYNVPAADAHGVAERVYREVLFAVDADARKVSPGSLSFPVHTFCDVLRTVSDPLRLATEVLDARIDRIVQREMQYLGEFDTLYRAYYDGLLWDDGEDTHGIMVLTEECRAVNLFLRRCDSGQMIRFVVMPERVDGMTRWSVLTVDFQRQRFNTYAPIRPELGDADVLWVNRRRFKAQCRTLDSALALARASRRAYESLANLPQRLWRWLAV